LFEQRDTKARTVAFPSKVNLNNFVDRSQKTIKTLLEKNIGIVSLAIKIQ